MKKCRQILFLVATLFLFVTSTISVKSVYAYKNPGAPTGFADDFAGVIDQDSEQQLESSLTELEQQTGVEFSVVTVKSLGGDTIENFAHSLFQDWGIGAKASNKGLLLLIAIKDHRARFEVGYGLEGTLTDLLTSKIQQQYMIPQFKAGDYTGGIKDAIGQVVGILKGDVSVDTYQTPEVVDQPVYVPVSIWSKITSDFFPFFLYLIFPSLIFFFQLIVYSMARSKSYWMGGALFGGVGLTVTELLFAGFSNADPFSFFKLGTVGLVSVFCTCLGLIIDYRLSKKGVTEKSFAEFIKKGSAQTGGSSIGFLDISDSTFGGDSSSDSFGGFGGGSSGGGGSSSSW
ncbi:MAG: TPM domain-containing protein [bacterium]